VGLLPGEIFVHRNVANVVVHTDLNCCLSRSSPLDVLKGPARIVCGHYGCAGVTRSPARRSPRTDDNCFATCRTVRDKSTLRCSRHSTTKSSAAIGSVIECDRAGAHVCQTASCATRGSAARNSLVHSWIYGLHDGLIRDLGMAVSSWKEVKRPTRKPILHSESPQVGREQASACNSFPFFRSQRQRITNKAQYMAQPAIGLIETRGLVASSRAPTPCSKRPTFELAGPDDTSGNALVTAVVVGDVRRREGCDRCGAQAIKAIKARSSASSHRANPHADVVIGVAEKK